MRSLHIDILTYWLSYGPESFSSFLPRAPILATRGVRESYKDTTTIPTIVARSAKRNCKALFKRFFAIPLFPRAVRGDKCGGDVHIRLVTHLPSYMHFHFFCVLPFKNTPDLAFLDWSGFLICGGKYDQNVCVIFFFSKNHYQCKHRSGPIQQFRISRFQISIATHLTTFGRYLPLATKILRLNHRGIIVAGL